MIDRERVVAEVATRNGIRIGKHDPLFAVMTVAQLALEESVEDLRAKLASIIAEFEVNVRAVERRAGKVLAQEVKDCATEMRSGIQDDISAAGVKARDLVQPVVNKIDGTEVFRNVVLYSLLCALRRSISAPGHGLRDPCVDVFLLLLRARSV